MKIYFGGGLNEQESPLMIEAGAGSYNFDLDFQSYKYRPRLPFDLKGTAPNGKPITGLMQLIKRDDTETTLVQANETIYRWNGSSTWSSIGSCATASHLRDTYWSLDDYIVVTDLDKATEVSRYNGTTFSTLTTGIGTQLYAKYSVVFGNRVWLFNVKTTTDTPHLLVASAFENPTSYDTTKRVQDPTFTLGTEAFYMTTPDLRPINGVALLFNTIVVSTEGGRLYKLIGDDSRSYAFTDFFPASNAIGEEGVCSIGNDVLYVGRNGRIDMLSATDKYGDISANDVSRFVPTTSSLIADPIVTYDQKRQKVLIFWSGHVLVLHKDILVAGALVNEKGERIGASPWTHYKTDHSSGFATEVVKYMRIPGSQDYSVYFGASDGKVFDLNGSGEKDGGVNEIKTVRKTPVIYDKRFYSHNTRGSVWYKTTAPVTFYIDFDWVEELSTSTVQVNIPGPDVSSSGYYFGGSVYWNGSFYYNVGFQFSEKQTRQNFSPVGKGPGVALTCYATSNQRWTVDSLELF